jgi:hypothetical protein
MRDQLVQASGLHPPIERIWRMLPTQLFKVQAALERGGIEFLDDDRPGVRLRASTIKRPEGR